MKLFPSRSSRPDEPSPTEQPSRAARRAALHRMIDGTTVDELRRRGSFKWDFAGPDGLGAAVAEMDFGAAPAIVDALDAVITDARFGYLSDRMTAELATVTADFEQRRFGWSVDPALIHPVADVIRGLELCIEHYSRPGSPVILPTPAYMPFLAVPGTLGRKIIQVPMPRDESGRHVLDLDAIDAAFVAGGDLVVLCNPYNPLGRVFERDELTALTAVVDRHGGRVFADEIHAPLVYPGSTHVPYASTSDTAAAHTFTATSASKGWNLAGLKCAEVILTDAGDQQVWDEIGPSASHGTSTPGVAANVAAFRDATDWLDDVVAYLDESRRHLRDRIAADLPGVTHRSPDGTYLAWLDCTALDLPGSAGELVTARSGVTVVDGPAFGEGGAGSFRLNFATPRPILDQMIDRIAAALAST